MRYRIKNTRILLISGDITEQETDAIVNAANSTLMGGGGVDGTIHRKGGPEIIEECKNIRNTVFPNGLPVGQAVITTGGRLKAKKVIHIVGPVWNGGNNNEPLLLEEAYRNSLNIALENGIRTISFPSISTGAYGYPVEKASRIAVNAVVRFLEEFNGIDEVRFIVHSSHHLDVYKKALSENSQIRCSIQV